MAAGARDACFDQASLVAALLLLCGVSLCCMHLGVASKLASCGAGDTAVARLFIVAWYN